VERVCGQRASKKCAATAEERCRHAAVDINTNHTLLQDEDTTLGSDKLNEELILRLLDTHTHRSRISIRVAPVGFFIRLERL